MASKYVGQPPITAAVSGQVADLLQVQNMMDGEAGTDSARARALEAPDVEMSSPAPPSVAFSVVDDWSLSVLPEATTMQSEFKERMLAGMRGICAKFGGPRQYLLSCYNTPQKRMEFGAALVRLFPLDPSVLYHTDLPVPEIAESDLGDSAL